MKRCEVCKENIKENDKVILTYRGEIYHEGCCKIYAQKYSVFVNGNYVGDTEQSFMYAKYAWWLLGENEYEEEYDEEVAE